MKKLLCILAIVIWTGYAAAQMPGTGAYPFSSIDNRGFDSVNIGNLNTHFQIPIVSRQGRGLPFNYSLVYDGLIWSAVTSNGTTTWQPDSSWGLHGQLSETLTGYITYSIDLLTCGRSPTASPVHVDLAYHDAYGASHALNYHEGFCGVAPSGGMTTDGSGYHYDGVHLYSRYGQVIDAPMNPIAGSAGTGTITDSNGNTITDNINGTFTDTLGVTALAISGGNPLLFTYPVTLQANQAATASASLSYKTYTVRTNFQCAGIGEYPSTTANLPDRITLADGSFYAFTYEATPGATDGAVTARLASVRLPTQGVINYKYTGGCSSTGAGINPDGTVGNLIRTTSDGIRTYGRSPVNSNATSTNLQDEKGNQSVYQFSIVAGLFYETHRQVYQGAVGSNQLLDRYTCYNGAVAPCDGQAVAPPFAEVDVTTSYNGGTQDLSKSTYDSLGNLIREGEYNGTTLLEQNSFSYNANSELLSSVVTDGSNNTVSSTTYGYDDPAPTATSGIPQHNAATAARGNQTSIKVATGSGSTTLTTTTSYYDTGVPISTTTPNGTTSYQYDSTQTFATQTTLPTPSSGIGLSTGASYDGTSAALLSATGMNTEQTTKVTQYDGLLRPIAVTFPNQAQLTYSYPALNQTTTSMPLGNGTTVQTITDLDSFGRLSRAATYSGQTSASWYMVDSCYDTSGMLKFQSASYLGDAMTQPLQCSGAGTGYVYDALGRTTSTTTSDGTATTQYSNRAVKTTDVNGIQRITQYDLLGRVSGICEISSSTLGNQSPTNCNMDIAGTGYVTSYSYNLATHTTSITQGSQTRTFQTDWAGRTVSVTEPERGATTYAYTYNSTGLQVVRARPRANQSSPSVLTHTTTQYDSLGRIVSVSYDDGLTPGKNYYYDAVPSGLQWAQTPTNPKGQLVATASGSGTTLTRSLYGYDLMGNVTSLLQCAPSICGGSSQTSRPLTFGYDLGNNLINEYDPASGAISYTRSPAGQVTAITNGTYQDTANPANLVTGVTNTQFGATNYTLGNGLQAVQTFDAVGRLNGGWLCNGSSSAGCAGGTQLYGNNAGWSGARMGSSCDTITNQCQFQGYDEFNRLNSVTATNGGAQGNYTYSYDRWGNRLSQTSSSGGPSPSVTVNDATNQVVGYTYDAAGNLLIDGVSHTFTYDAEGNVLNVDNGNSGIYVYDALNQRISTQTASGAHEYLFDPFGRRTSTWLTSPNFGVEGRIYWDKKQIAFRAQSGQTFFDHKSILGTERLRTNYQGETAATETSLAFGDNFKQTVVLSNSDQDDSQFAGQDHDTESSTEHAQFRQYSSTLGRWMSPDPYDGSYNLQNPQSFNRYTYVLNNPYSLKDPLGLDDDCSTRDNGDDGGYGGEDCGGGGGGDDGGNGNSPAPSPGPVDPTNCNDPQVSCVSPDPNCDYDGCLTDDPLPEPGQIPQNKIPDPPNFYSYPFPATAVLCTTSTGVSFSAPSGFSLSNIVANGQANGLTGAGAAVAQGGYYDFQRFQIGADTLFFYRYTPVANISVGAYLYGTGVSPSVGSLISNAYAKIKSANGATAQQAQFRNLGFALASGKATYSCQSHP
jgi:RHS repeat-associated protein